MLIRSSTCDFKPSGDLFLRPECRRSGAEHNKTEIPGRGLARGPVHVILHCTYNRNVKRGSGGVRNGWDRELKRSQVITTLRFRGLLRQRVEQVFVGRGVHVARIRVSLH